MMKTQADPGTQSAFGPTELAERTLHRRAVEAVVWGMPAVNTDLMYQAMARETKGGWNQIVYWSRLLDWKNQTLTPNPDAIYLMPFFNTAEAGPMVLEIPPGKVMTTVQNELQAIETRIGTLEFTHDFANGYPTDKTVEKLYDERDFQRGCQAYLWSLPGGLVHGVATRNHEAARR
jgi:hypothetical protein